MLWLGTECLSRFGQLEHLACHLDWGAVHPTLPYLAQGAGMAVEDAAIPDARWVGPRLSLTRFSFINENDLSGSGGLFGKRTKTEVV